MSARRVEAPSWDSLLSECDVLANSRIVRALTLAYQRGFLSANGSVTEPGLEALSSQEFVLTLEPDSSANFNLTSHQMVQADNFMGYSESHRCYVFYGEMRLVVTLLEILDPFLELGLFEYALIKPEAVLVPLNGVVRGLNSEQFAFKVTVVSVLLFLGHGPGKPAGHSPGRERSTSSALTGPTPGPDDSGTIYIPGLKSWNAQPLHAAVKHSYGAVSQLRSIQSTPELLESLHYTPVLASWSEDAVPSPTTRVGAGPSGRATHHRARVAATADAGGPGAIGNSPLRPGPCCSGRPGPGTIKWTRVGYSKRAAP